MNYQARALADALRTTRGPRSLREIAPEIPGVSVSTLSRLEREAMPDVQTLLHVCEWLGRPVTDFIKRTPSELPAELAEAIEKTRLMAQALYYEAGEKTQQAKKLEGRITIALRMFETGKPTYALDYLGQGPRK